MTKRARALAPRLGGPLACEYTAARTGDEGRLYSQASEPRALSCFVSQNDKCKSENNHF